MKATQAPFPSFGVDCVTVLDPVSAYALKRAGAAFAVRYLGSVTNAELTSILGAGLLVALVTYADQWDPARAVADLSALGVPAGVTVWLDVESVPQDPTQEVNAWADAVQAGGWQPGLYVGSNTGLTAQQLYGLRVVRYWRSMSDVPTPKCGYCMQQLFPTTVVAGVPVDVDVVQQDWEGRVATFIGP